MVDAVEQLRRFNAGREPERLAMKYRRMSKSPFAFLRGSCHLFYQRLPRTLGKTPLVWACGDLHLENFGSYRGDNGQVYFDINDFDEAMLAPASWDVVRLLSSVLVARALFGAGRKQAREACKGVLDHYGRSLREGKARWVERETASQPVRRLLAQAHASHHGELLAARTRNDRLRLLKRRALPATERDQLRVAALFEKLRRRYDDLAGIEVLDVARRVAGTGSLGLERFVILVEQKDRPEREHLLDLKIATAPAALEFGPKLVAQPTFADHAVRIVSVQRRFQAIAMASLHAVRMGGRPFVLRRLQPSEDRVDLSTMREDRLPNLLRTLSECLAWDQLRSAGRAGSAIADVLIAHGEDRSWQAPLLKAALEAAEHVERDHDAFLTAYEHGRFD
jgi:uncharacterized protein (DUF2252 family)